MGTRMLATTESGVHDNMKKAVVAASETDTMLIGKHTGKQVRVLRTAATAPYELSTEGNPLDLLGNIDALYRRGDIEGSLAQLGQVAGRIESIETAAEVVRATVAEFEETLGAMAKRYLAGS
jgi:enoyl-[acyl-carrier protein] reductase II